MLDFVRIGREENATAVAGGNAPQGELQTGFFVEPTVFSGVHNRMRIAREEIFGPVVCAIPFDELDEVATAMNQTAYGLAGAIWTKDVGKAHRLARAMKAGTVWINCYNIFDATLPFGGYKQSGWGREMGEEVFHNYTGNCSPRW